MKNLILILDSLEANWPFLKHEIHFLTKSFENIQLIPLSEGKWTDQNFFPNIFIEKHLSKQLINQKKRPFSNFQKYFSRFFIHEILSIPKNKFIFYNLKHTFWVFNLAVLIKNWLVDYFYKNDLDVEDCLIYTYWFNYSSVGACLFKSINPSIKIITRLHGGDLYEERKKGRYFPFRVFCNQLLDRLFFISDQGKDYYSIRYPTISKKFFVSRLGVPDPGFTTSPSNDGNIRLVSCSFLLPIKRIHLIVQGLICLCEMMPDKEIFWFHFGNGPLMTEIQMLLESKSKNLIPQLFGYVNNNEILNFYHKNHIDLFINTSASEGVPVSIMEAQSCGIPVIAPNIGGIPEIVSKENGYLLTQDPTNVEISEKILNYYKKYDFEKLKMRNASKLVWSSKYNSSTNFRNFCEIISKI